MSLLVQTLSMERPLVFDKATRDLYLIDSAHSQDWAQEKTQDQSTAEGGRKPLTSSRPGK